MSEIDSPHCLIAVPQLDDPNFHRSVVVLLEQGDGGALGVIVNRETNLLLTELCKDHAIDYAGDPHKRVRRGGPVQPEQGIVIYGVEHQDPEGRPVSPALHVSASTGTLTRLCGLTGGGRFHCLSGYSGWAPGQLEREINEGSWIVIPVDARLILDVSPEKMWEQDPPGRGDRPGRHRSRIGSGLSRTPVASDRPGAGNHGSRSAGS